MAADLIKGNPLEALGKVVGPALDGAGEHARVDKVELLVPLPLHLEVVDEELDIWRDTEVVSCVCLHLDLNH